MGNMVKHQLKTIAKNPTIMINFFGYPVILTLIIGYLTQGFYGEGISSYEYYSNSMLIFIFMGAGLITVYNFIDSELVDGSFRAVYAPVKRSTIYISQIISTTIFSVIGIILNIIIFRFLVGVNYNGSELFIILSLGTLAFLSSAVAVFLSGFMSEIGKINQIFNLIQIAFCVLGGAFISMDALGELAGKTSLISPVKYIIDGIFLSIYDGKDLMILIISVINIILGLIVIMLAKRKYKFDMYI